MDSKPKLKLQGGRRYLRRDGEIGIAQLVPPTEIQWNRGGGPIFFINGWYYAEDGELGGLGWDHPRSLVKEVSRLSARRPSKCPPLGMGEVDG